MDLHSWKLRPCSLLQLHIWFHRHEKSQCLNADLGSAVTADVAVFSKRQQTDPRSALWGLTQMCNLCVTVQTRLVAVALGIQVSRTL